MRDAAIGLMARYPRSGTVKTRLARSLGNEVALRVYKSLLGQACRLVTGLDANEFCRIAFVTPDDDNIAFESEYPGFEGYYQQRGTNLGERMRNALSTMLCLPGICNAMLIGADCPGLNAEHIRNAVSLLSSHDLTLGPTADGGYYLFGTKKVRPQLFSEIKWGSSTVTDKTIVKAKALGLSTGLLSQLRDLDDRHDLEYFDRMKLI